jgi:hypothetical protein
MPAMTNVPSRRRTVSLCDQRSRPTASLLDPMTRDPLALTASDGIAPNRPLDTTSFLMKAGFTSLSSARGGGSR